MSQHSPDGADRILIATGSAVTITALLAAVALHEQWLLLIAAIGFCAHHLGWANHRRRIGGAR
ncbi:hypothetical protein ACWGIU_13410 [Streptomyces sp. NPDC054840]